MLDFLQTLTNILQTKIPIGSWVEGFIFFLRDNLEPVFDAFTKGVETLIDGLVDLLLLVPPPLLIIAFTLVALFLARRRIAVFTIIGLTLIYNLGLWEATMETLSLVTIATFISLIFGMPLGILTARSKMAHNIITPALDFMQTMPAFVYLIPAIMLLDIGVVSAAFATVIFSMPPTIRLTGLGIKQVPEELIEAAEAFGSTPRQKLFKVQLPMAMPTIMAGINQSIMLALSMVVIAAMIGAGGLGALVLRAISRLKVGLGFESGLGVVILAIILDRITQSLGTRKKNNTKT